MKKKILILTLAAAMFFAAFAPVMSAQNRQRKRDGGEGDNRRYSWQRERNDRDYQNNRDYRNDRDYQSNRDYRNNRDSRNNQNNRNYRIYRNDGYRGRGSIYIGRPRSSYYGRGENRRGNHRRPGY